MRRTSLLSRLPSLALCAALLAGSGCVFHFGSWGSSTSDLWGQSVSSDAGVLSVDGTPLPFDRWVDVTADLSGADKLELGTASDSIRVSGAAGTTATLRARLYSEVQGDGSAVIEHGRLVARSQGGGKVFINAIEGTVPAGLALNAVSGTGAVEVSAMAGDQRVELSSGTGELALRGSKVGSAKLDNGTGDSLLQDTTLASLDISTGTGDVALDRCHATEVKLDSGTGDATVVGCELGALNVSCGTGDLTIDGGKLERVVFDSGTGDLTQRNSPAIGSLKES